MKINIKNKKMNYYKTETCYICGEKFSSLEEVKDHKFKVHYTYPCEICSIVFDSYHELYKHELYNHRRHKSKCTICGDMIYFLDLKKHMDFHFPEYIHECCGKFLVGDMIEEHYKVYHPKLPKFNCCDKLMNWEEYSIHKRKHNYI